MKKRRKAGHRSYPHGGLRAWAQIDKWHLDSINTDFI